LAATLGQVMCRLSRPSRIAQYLVVAGMEVEMTPAIPQKHLQPGYIYSL